MDLVKLIMKHVHASDGSVETQTKGMIQYAKERYGSIGAAIRFRESNGWWYQKRAGVYPALFISFNVFGSG